MKEASRKISDTIIRTLADKNFFYFIVFIFIIEALWIAFSFRFPMPYDERYHFELIRFFSTQWLPWIHTQPVSLDQYGAFERDSYLLYHYVLSFPFRIISLLTDNFAMQVIAVRIMNIALFTSGIFIFSRLFKQMNIKQIFINIVTLFFAILPVAPFVAATVNYDNAIFPLTAAFMLVGLLIIKSPKLRWDYWVLLIIIGMAGCLCKSAFPPIFAAGFLFLIAVAYKHRSHYSYSLLAKSFNNTKLSVRIILVLLFVVVGFLFTERFGINIVKYHSLSPSCTKQLSKERCLLSPINSRAERMENSKPETAVQLPYYASTWFDTMTEGLIATGSIEKDSTQLTIRPALPIMFVAIMTLVVFSFMAIFYRLDKIRKTTGFWFLIIITSVYVTSLFYVNVDAYYHYHRYLAIQGRYLLPILPIVLVFSLLAINYSLEKARYLKLPFLIGAIIILSNGAGLVTHITLSQDSWYWDNHTVRDINGELRQVLKPIVKEEWY